MRRLPTDSPAPTTEVARPGAVRDRQAGAGQLASFEYLRCAACLDTPSTVPMALYDDPMPSLEVDTGRVLLLRAEAGRVPRRTVVWMDATARDLRRYYEAEAQQRVRSTLRRRRVGLVTAFISELDRAARRSVIDVGSGPGLDGEHFVAAGIQYVGVDLALGNALLATERHLSTVQADVCALPIRRHVFDAAWSMSTLMHLPAERVRVAIGQMADVVRPGSPMVVGMWGGDFGDVVSENGLPGHRRLFSLRSVERNAELLSDGGAIESATTWGFGSDEWEYQVFRLRSAAA